ncbi:MAG TPA: CoA transferase [Actinomycetota bacterium]|nr:CoA transferase [Actinomycetota bacterium]
MTEPTERPAPGAPRPNLPLAGVRVLDLSRVLAGPLCTMILGDLGADVVKVERPGEGDDTRSWGPPFVGPDAAYFLALNRNKRSVVLDLGSEEGLAAARRLARGADVLVENFRPGLVRRWGLDHETLARDNPGLVSCSLTAFGEEGELARRPGYDIVVQALSGLMSVTGERGGRPVKVGVALLDVIAGLYAAVGILAALRERERTGRGRRVTVSLFDASVAALVNQAANVLLGGLVPGPMGTEHPNIVPYQAFEAADRPFVLAAGNDRLFERTCEAIGHPELARDPRFATNEARVRHREELVPILAEVFRSRPAADWLQALAARSVPAALIRRIDEVFDSAEGRAMVEVVRDPARGELRLVASPIALDGARLPLRRPPPLLGEHTEEVLGELGTEPGGAR